MTSWIPVALGVLLIVAIAVDALWTTISASGGGPVSSKITVAAWKVARGIYRLTSRRTVFRLATPVALMATLLTWFLSMWVGWTLIFSMNPEAIVYEATGDPVVAVDRFYFAAMVFLTLGTGDVVATTPGWRLISAIASFNGLAIITITITYLVSVLSAVIEKRQLAALVGNMGSTPSQILQNGWDGEGFHLLETKLSDIANKLTRHAERHLAYPILQYFHPPDAQSALPVSLALLEDTSTLLAECVASEARPNETVLRSVNRALDLYLKRVQLEHVTDVDTAPPLPNLTSIRRRKIPVHGDHHCTEAFDERRTRRVRLAGILNAEDWEWPTESPKDAPD